MCTTHRVQFSWSINFTIINDHCTSSSHTNQILIARLVLGLLVYQVMSHRGAISTIDKCPTTSVSLSLLEIIQWCKQICAYTKVLSLEQMICSSKNVSARNCRVRTIECICKFEVHALVLHWHSELLSSWSASINIVDRARSNHRYTNHRWSERFGTRLTTTTRCTDGYRLWSDIGSDKGLPLHWLGQIIECN